MNVGLELDVLIERGLPARRVKGENVRVREVHHDSREVTEGALFVALPGARTDGTEHIEDAVARGAVAVLARRDIACTVPLLVSDDPVYALGRAAELIQGEPTRALCCLGITGTNGKTTTSSILVDALRALGHRPAVIGTGAMQFEALTEKSAFTTPFGDDVARFARRVLDAGATHLVMEVSSHALEQRRVHAVRFDVAALTNLTQDHLDFHGSMEAYGASKTRFFKEFGPIPAVLNLEDPFARSLVGRTTGEALTVGLSADAGVHVRSFELLSRGIRADLVFGECEATLESGLVGAHNLENLLVALGTLLASGIDFPSAVRVLGEARGAEGRLELVPHPGEVLVAVDYAHTDDALRRVLAALRPFVLGRLLVVFGCGGDRDRAKRPRMGRAACEGADLVVVTSDNPRSESPRAIADDILPGLEGAQALDAASFRRAARGFVVELDRRAAIELALEAARPGDVVLLAGKGHETVQIVGDERRPFDDRVVATEAIARITRGER